MKKFEIVITVKNGEDVLGERKAVNIRKMWAEVTEAFKEHPEATLHITKDGADFMRLHRVQIGNGKFWCKNDIKESRRHTKVKTEKSTEDSTIETTPEVEKPVTTETPVEETAEFGGPETSEEQTETPNLENFKIPTIDEVENIAANN